MILPNVRESFGRAEAQFVLDLLARGDEKVWEREEERLREEGFDALLDDPRSYNALMAAAGVSVSSAPLVFYMLVRHALLEGGMGDRSLADYLAALLLNFGERGRAHRIEEADHESFHYLVEIVEAIESARGRRAFLLHAHLGNFALWLSGLFPDAITARVQRRGAPGLEYYEELGATGFRLAADCTHAGSFGLDRVYKRCAESFQDLRISLNRIADRYLFPNRGDPIERLLRQVADRFRPPAQQN
ncbi:MAG: hypothetical protein HY703_02610 [Gemmatimonadetes bacterium]|nr:hypothetical protein [Gemmatimonadota bacterium]